LSFCIKVDFPEPIFPSMQRIIGIGRNMASSVADTVVYAVEVAGVFIMELMG
jgi:hypothetical protein